MIIHASCVCVDNKAALILGASGAGKSQLALALIGRGAMLVSDDRTCLHRTGSKLIGSCPDAIAGQIEARQFGILTVPYTPHAPIICAIDLEHTETQRLPPRRTMTLLETQLHLFHNSEMKAFPDAIMQYLLHTASDPI